MSFMTRAKVRAGSLLGLMIFSLVLMSASVGQANDKPRARASSAGPAKTISTTVDLNSAGVAQLKSLPGIGPARAKAIIELRDKIGGFKRLEQLLRVRGIGRKTFRRLRPLLRLSGPGDKRRRGKQKSSAAVSKLSR